MENIRYILAISKILQRENFEIYYLIVDRKTNTILLTECKVFKFYVEYRAFIDKVIQDFKALSIGYGYKIVEEQWL